jgi:hypothetical protein
MRRSLVTSLLILCALAVPASAAARPLVIGLGDQQHTTFQDPKLHKLGLKTARLALAWNWYTDAHTIAQTDWWVAAVRAAGMRPMISFNRSWRRGDHGGRRIPSMRRYRKSFRILRARYPYIREFSAWNEPNAPEQPFAKKPKRAARFYNAMRSACPRCTVVAGDINDSRNMSSWLAVYRRHVRRPKVWALHNYRDATQSWGTTRVFLRMVRGPVWLTETGGMRSRGGLKGQARAVRRVFDIARTYHRIKRVYFYQWKRTRGRAWDSAFLNANGTRRPAFGALRAGLRRL